MSDYLNVKHILNTELKTEIAQSGAIEIFELTKSNLQSLGFLDESGWPTQSGQVLIKDIDNFSPSDFEHDCSIWDLLPRGFSIYNNFIKDARNP